MSLVEYHVFLLSTAVNAPPTQDYACDISRDYSSLVVILGLLWNTKQGKKNIAVHATQQVVSMLLQCPYNFTNLVRDDVFKLTLCSFHISTWVHSEVKRFNMKIFQTIYIQ